MFGVDTFSWFYLIQLRDNGFADLITRVMDKKVFMITHDVRIELNHRFPNEDTFFRKVTILPRLNKSFTKFIKQGFDEADASLLEYGEISGYVIITEDQPMLLENILDGKLRIIHLADYFGLLMLEKEISPRELFQVIKALRKWGVISKPKAKRILRLRSQIT
jgi:rRNA-processing protein FCF1